MKLKGPPAPSHLLVVGLLVLGASCSIYRSADREEFEGNPTLHKVRASSVPLTLLSCQPGTHDQDPPDRSEALWAEREDNIIRADFESRTCWYSESIPKSESRSTLGTGSKSD
jgi:hypothetical protein